MFVFPSVRLSARKSSVPTERISVYVEIRVKCQLDATEVFIADFIAC